LRPPGRLASFTHAGFTHAGFTCADIDALPLPKTATGARRNLQWTCCDRRLSMPLCHSITDANDDGNVDVPAKFWPHLETLQSLLRTAFGGTMAPLLVRPRRPWMDGRGVLSVERGGA
jgi:hypothetical protein